MRNEDELAQETFDPFGAMRSMVESFTKAEVELEFVASDLAKAEERLAKAGDTLGKMLMSTPETLPSEPGGFSHGIVIEGVCYFAEADERDKMTIHRVPIAWTVG